MTRHISLTVVALALVAVGVVSVARMAGESGTSSLPAVGAAQEATPAPTASPPPTELPADPSIANLRITQYEIFLSRDPFEPVIFSAPTGDSPDGPVTSPTVNPTIDPTIAPTISPTISPTIAPTTSPTTSPTASPSPGSGGSPEGCVDNGTVVCDGQVVKLIDVYDDGQPGAVVQVDETAYEVRAGETFAGNYLVRSVDAPCATLLYGDDAFTLCEGESTLK